MKTTPRAAVVLQADEGQRELGGEQETGQQPGSRLGPSQSQRRPRQRIQPSSSTKATMLRIETCTSAGTSGSASLIETWLRPHSYAAQQQAQDGDKIEMERAGMGKRQKSVESADRPDSVRRVAPP